MPDPPRPPHDSAEASSLRFVLVRPEHPGNVGASARALKNMGFADLRVVGHPSLAQHADAVRMAHGAEDLLGRIRWCDNLSDALSGCRWTYGTTRRVRKPRASCESLRGLRQRLAPLATSPQTSRLPLAVVFGPEKDGLCFEDLAVCQAILTIPTSTEHPSLNLAQAVLLVAWELSPLAPTTADTTQADTATHDAATHDAATHDAATHEELEGLYTHLEAMLHDIGFVQPETARHQMLALRGLLSRTLPTRREVTQLRGICRQASWAARHRPEDRSDADPSS
jgi:TrmH family RNA methyltransferase